MVWMVADRVAVQLTWVCAAITYKCRDSYNWVPIRLCPMLFRGQCTMQMPSQQEQGPVRVSCTRSGHVCPCSTCRYLELSDECQGIYAHVYIDMIIQEILNLG